MKLILPAIKSFIDYHEIENAEDILTFFAEKKVKSKELPDAFDGRYWAVFYEDKLPSNEEINRLLNDAGYFGAGKTDGILFD